MIHLIVGNTGAGKSTYSKKLVEKYGAILFSIDEWNNTLFLKDKPDEDNIDWMLERINRAEQVMWNLCLQLDMQSQDAVLDLGFSKKDHREKFRNLAKKNGIEYKLHFLDFSKEVRMGRILKRNQEKGETYVFDVNQEMFDFMEDWFERPTNKELESSIIIDTVFKSDNEEEVKNMVEVEEQMYLAYFSAQHHDELSFCMRLSQGIDDEIGFDVLRVYVLDYWERYLSEYLKNEESVFVNLNNREDIVQHYFQDHEQIKSMMNAIANSDSVSKNYLIQLMELLKAHIRFEVRSFYPYILESYDGETLKKIKNKWKASELESHLFSPSFWEN